ncbi:MAG: hypothetical protein H6739_30250 [Alphaproteobacteria bacterium]|nr:hypothetical protein [Alphaproteobacteria bacterium]
MAYTKSFDPLASLFDAPLRRPPGVDLPVDEDDDDISAFGDVPVAEDVVAPQVFNPAHAEAPELPMAMRTPPPEPPPEPSAAPPAAPPATPTVDEDAPTTKADAEPPVEDKVALARRLAAEALARAQQARPKPPEPAEEDKVALARRLAAEALARTQQQKAPPPPSEEDKIALAKRLAAEAQARAAAKAAAKATAKAATKAPAAPKASKASSKKPASRFDSLAARAKRPRSALDAIREAAQAEEESRKAREAEAAAAEVHRLADRISDMLRRQLAGVKTLEVVNALVLDDRAVLRALWKGHRARFAIEGALDQVVSTTHVVRALDAVAPGQLVAAIVNTDRSDYLVFVDLGSQATIAAFADARAWYTNLQE